MTDKAYLAFQAAARQGIELVSPKGLLLIGADQLHHVSFADIAQQVLGLDEVVAGVQIAVVFQCESVTAGRIENAHPGQTQAHPTAH